MDIDLPALVSLVAARDPRAVPALDELIVRLTSLRDELAAETAPDHPFSSPGGFGDRVRMQVVAPDGSITQSVDTHQPGVPT